MGTLHDFEQAQKEHLSTKKRVVKFYGATFRREGEPGSSQANVTIEDGDVAGIIAAVIRNYGIWSDDGSFFIPWPCALVEITD